MIHILDVASMRESDAAAIAGGTPGQVLMGRAGAEIFRAAAWKAPVAIVCGKGNNAGDGFVLGVELAGAGIPCTLFLWERSFSAKRAASLCACGPKQRRWPASDPWRTAYSEQASVAPSRERLPG